jgi:drug/metabolite transporter (DMT)-like permease
MTVEKKKESVPSSFAIWSAMTTVYIIWGSTFLAIRFAIETIPPFLMAAIRFLIAGGTLYVIRRSRGDAAPSRGEWRVTGIIGILLLVCGNGGVVWAEQHVASGVAALLIGAAPLWMVLIEFLNPQGRRAGGPFWVSFLICGIGVLIGPSQLTGSGESTSLGGCSYLLLPWATGPLRHRPHFPLLSVGTAMEMGEEQACFS